VPDGTATGGDWYLATVQQKIWMLWQRQVQTGPQLAVRVSFTILADGRVQDVRVVQSSGVYLLDQAAQRAVVSAAPFGPLPKNYGTNRFTIHALFKPSS
jgi:TonB family protein